VTSGERTFDDVRTAADAQFPEQDPTQGEVAERLERIDTRIAELRTAIGDEGGGQSTVVAWAALGVAAAALVLGLARRRERGAS
jgi:hypothetical protein